MHILLKNKHELRRLTNPQMLDARTGFLQTRFLHVTRSSVQLMALRRHSRSWIYLRLAKHGQIKPDKDQASTQDTMRQREQTTATQKQSRGVPEPLAEISAALRFSEHAHGPPTKGDR
uniref:Uncharacterized protein n=1 Tax=Anguilla anguilla TaxID=7936 RepID=A0A0E9R5K9_ANGAN